MGSSKVWQIVRGLCGRGDKGSHIKQLQVVWLTLFTVTWLYVVFYLYFWLVVWGRFDDLNWKLYIRLDRWIPWYTIVFALTCAAFIYFTFFMLVFMVVMCRGHQPYIHPVHVLVSVVSLSVCVAVTIYINQIWRSEWSTAYMSLKMTGPFLQLGLVALLTLCTWFLVALWMRMSSWVARTVCLLVYVSVMVVLYTSPLYITSPCVTDHLPQKPHLLAHRGASAVLPENTLMSYKKAFDSGVWGIESDVMISSDCVPFILHDRRLTRTTNVKNVFPSRALDDASTFTMMELKSLNAGQWFLGTDPWGSAGDLNPSERTEADSQTIPTLEELSKLAASYPNTVFMFDLYYPGEDHPCYNRSVNITIDAITAAGYPIDKVLWLASTFNGSRPTGVRLVGEEYVPVPDMRSQGIDITNVQYIELTDDNIREYQAANISVNIWVVNSAWMYSMYWCTGVHSVTTDRSHAFTSMKAPIWYMEPSTYLKIWISVDCVSVLAIIVIILIQRRRLKTWTYTV